MPAGVVKGQSTNTDPTRNTHFRRHLSCPAMQETPSSPLSPDLRGTAGRRRSFTDLQEGREGTPSHSGMRKPRNSFSEIRGMKRIGSQNSMSEMSSVGADDDLGTFEELTGQEILQALETQGILQDDSRIEHSVAYLKTRLNDTLTNHEVATQPTALCLSCSL